MNTKTYDLEDRLVSFASQIVFFTKKLPNDMPGTYYGNQLLRSGGSAALNFGEAQGTASIKDKVYKLTLSLKELKESRVNLKIINKVGYGNEADCKALLYEVEQLIKIIATIIKNKKTQLH